MTEQRLPGGRSFGAVRAGGEVRRPAQPWTATVHSVLRHLEDVGFFKTEEHPSEGRLRRTKLANTFSGGTREDETHAPLTGEHTRTILAEVGYSDAEIDALLASGGAAH
jgi:crotonobetainyl-CoA:carnitine CoA-transferase CaiB-like acyl-CoA transferase